MDVLNKSQYPTFGKVVTPYVAQPPPPRLGALAGPGAAPNTPVSGTPWATTPTSGVKPPTSLSMLFKEPPVRVETAAASQTGPPGPRITPKGQQVLAIASQVQKDYPVLRESAAAFISKALKQAFNKTLDPDKTYLHHFDKAHSSGVSFSGWAHNQPPIASMTITQAVLANYTAREQNLDTLDGYSAGLYSEGAGATTFDEHNEVKLLPSQLLNLIYSGDFYRTYTQQLKDFWTHHRSDHHVLAKNQFISYAVKQVQNKTLSTGAYSLIMRAIDVADITLPLPLDILKKHSTEQNGVQIRKFEINGYDSTDILQFQAPGHSRVVLYLAGENPPLREFENSEALNDWVCRIGPPDKASQQLAGHFSLYLRQDGATVFGAIGVDTSLKQLVSGTLSRAAINSNHSRISSTIVEDVFAHMSAAIERRELEDANTTITSTQEVNQEIWRERLALINTATALTAPFAAPINLMLALGSLAQFVSGVSRALDGDTTAQRKAGSVSAVLAVPGVIPAVTLATAVSQEVAIVKVLAPSEADALVGAEETIEVFLEEGSPAESLAPPGHQSQSWFGAPSIQDLRAITPDARGIYNVVSRAGTRTQFVVRNHKPFEVIASDTRVQLVHRPFARIVIDPISGEWTAVPSSYTNAADSPLQLLTEAMEKIGWSMGEGAANQLIAEQVFNDVRAAYSGGSKSTNKVYVGVTKASQLAARRDLAKQQLTLSRTTPSSSATPALPAGSSPAPSVPSGESLIIQAANCGELSNISAKLAMEYGGHAEQWVIENGDHAFTVIGSPPPGPTVDFADWDNVWIIDAWANILCPAKEYVAELVKKMGEWYVKGKQLTDGVRTFEATDTTWLSELINNRKRVAIQPSATNPFPWKDYTLEVRPLTPTSATATGGAAGG